jgi:uracil-DNA glycosylase family 4
MDVLAGELEDLNQSPLYTYRETNGYRVVVGEGSLDARVMFIGEAPGKQEAETGRPFVGSSGKVLTELLEEIGLARKDVYITNVVKDRPPDNRDPRAAEISVYAPYLERQINIIQPRVIATLGRFAMTFVLDLFKLPLHGEKISDLHGKPFAVSGGYGPVTIIPLYHPAVALYNRNQRKMLVADFQTLRRYM